MAEATESRQMIKVAKLVPVSVETQKKRVTEWWSVLEETREKLEVAAAAGSERDSETENVLKEESGFSTVGEMDAFIEKYNEGDLSYKSQYRDKYRSVMEYRALLSQAVFLMVEDQVGWGSAISSQDIDEWLPPPLKGLGDAVSNNLVTDVEFRGILAGLDSVVADVDFDSRESVDGYIRFLGSELQHVLKTTSNDAGFVDERSRVSVYLQYKLNQAKEVLEEFGDEERIPIPELVSDQFEKARAALGYIEDNDFKFGDILVSRQTNTLIAFLGSEKISPDLKKEIRARLHLHSLYPLMYAAGGFLDPRNNGSIPNALQRVYDAKTEINVADMTFFLRGESNGMKVKQFWDDLMSINYGSSYLSKVSEIMADTNFIAELKANKSFWEQRGLVADQYLTGNIGCFGSTSNESMVPSSKYWGDEKMNFQFDADVVRKEIVRMHILSREKYSRDDKKLLRKGLEMAEKLIVATGEDATMNAAFAGHHDLSELILTEPNTKDRQSKGKTIGSRRTMASLPSIGTTWLRAISSKDARGPLMSDDIDITAIGLPKGSEYFYYTAIVTKKLMVYQAAMMAETVDIKNIGSFEFWKGMLDAINKVAKYPSIVLDPKRNPDGMPMRVPDGPSKGAEVLEGAELLGVPASGVDKKKFFERKEARLRELLVESMAHLCASRPEMGMTLTQFKQIGVLLQRDNIVDDTTRKTVRFLTEKQWKSIYEAYYAQISEGVNTRKTLKRNETQETDDTVAKAVGGLINGK